MDVGFIGGWWASRDDEVRVHPGRNRVISESKRQQPPALRSTIFSREYRECEGPNPIYVE